MSPLPPVEGLREEFTPALTQAQTLESLSELRVLWLGRKGRLTNLLKQLGSLSLDEKRVFGPAYNKLRDDFEAEIAAREKSLAGAARQQALEMDTLDITLPGRPYPTGHLHPLMQVMTDLVAIFRSLGFVCADGPEVESEYYNFEALNIPANHPARDMQDTFYLQGGPRQLALPTLTDADSRQEFTLLRTHTSPVQARVMEQNQPPIAIVAPGRVYRNEAQDSTHSAIFHQMEGLLIDEGVSFADLKGTLSQFAQRFFAPNVRTRFKPSFFPFTEPSAQMDVSCWVCSGSGCRTCKQAGWIELLGAGMVNPNVLTLMKLDPEKYTGFAFGVGIERLAMLKYGVEDMRLFFENDLRFLAQF
jgi:phenylalanyl-tRNA synthetase alpha chain